MSTQTRTGITAIELVPTACDVGDLPNGAVDVLAVTCVPPVTGEGSMGTEPSAIRSHIDGVVIGWVVGEGGATGVPVDYPGNPQGAALRAVSTVAIGVDDVGREAALLFEAGDPRRPLLVGLIHRPETREISPSTTPAIEPIHVDGDGDRLTLTADKEIVLRCGKASITLTRAGKVLIRGAYLLSRSSGVNRIKGGSVQIN